MTEGSNVYCDVCWSLILDRGYVDRSDLCESCRAYVDAVDDLAGDQPVDVVHVERLIV